jgi:hypothetical protein
MDGAGCGRARWAYPGGEPLLQAGPPFPTRPLLTPGNISRTTVRKPKQLGTRSPVSGKPLPGKDFRLSEP